MRSLCVLILASSTVLLAACSSSSTPETSDAATKKDASNPRDAGKSDASDAGSADVSMGMDAPAQPVFTLDAGSTWTDLYRDYFGNDTQVHTAGCANGSFCHASTSDDGYAASGYLCPKGDKEACYKSLTMQEPDGPGLVMPDAGYASDLLGAVLCMVNDAGQPAGDGVMPYNCVYNFTPVDAERLKAWVQAGYPDN